MKGRREPKSKKDLARVTANLEELANTLPSQHLKERTIISAAVVPTKPTLKVVTEPVIQFSLSLRKSLRKELSQLASDEDVTMRAFVLDALKAKGLNVTDDDLIDRRRR